MHLLFILIRVLEIMCMHLYRDILIYDACHFEVVKIRNIIHALTFKNIYTC